MLWLALSLLALLPLSFCLGFLTAALLAASRATPALPPPGSPTLYVSPQGSTPGQGGGYVYLTASHFGESPAGMTPTALTPRIAGGTRLRGLPGGRSEESATPPTPREPNRTTAPTSSGNATAAPGESGPPPATAGSHDGGAA